MNAQRNLSLSKTNIQLMLLLFLLACGQAVQAAEEPSMSGYKTFGTMGKEVRTLSTAEEAELYSHQGKGCLTHMWFGGKFTDYGLTRIRVYVDGEKEASIDMELMLGHGIGFQDITAAWGIARLGKTGQPSGIYNTYRIPFGSSVRVTAQLAGGAPDHPKFWWIIRGTENLPVEVAGVRLPSTARLKLHKVENHTAEVLSEFDICKSDKAGVLYQVTVAAKSTNLNYMEACVRAYIDGAKKPLLLSSGLEDYFLGTYYFNRGKFYTPTAGITHLNKANGTFSAYRFHEDDPVFFHDGFRLTLRCGEQVEGRTVGKPQPTTYTTYAWAYEWPSE